MEAGPQSKTTKKSLSASWALLGSPSTCTWPLSSSEESTMHSLSINIFLEVSFFCCNKSAGCSCKSADVWTVHASILVFPAILKFGLASRSLCCLTVLRPLLLGSASFIGCCFCFCRYIAHQLSWPFQAQPHPFRGTFVKCLLLSQRLNGMEQCSGDVISASDDGTCRTLPCMDKLQGSDHLSFLTQWTRLLGLCMGWRRHMLCLQYLSSLFPYMPRVPLDGVRQPNIWSQK